jgi:tetratricopeptide (TPR) repeat protein
VEDAGALHFDGDGVVVVPPEVCGDGGGGVGEDDVADGDRLEVGSGAAQGGAGGSRMTAGAERLAALCGHLPLALQIAAALLATDRGKPVAELAEELALDHLDDGERSIRATFDLSYRRLPSDQARLLRLLALMPGREADTEAIAALLGDGGRSPAWGNLGLALRRAEQVEEAIAAHTRALDHYRATGDRTREARAWGNLGIALQQAGRAEEAIAAHTRSRDLHRALGDRNREASAWNNLGNDLHLAGRRPEAIAAFRRALKLFAEFDDWYATGRALRNLARVHLAGGDSASARTVLARAADAFTRANAPAEAAEAREAAEAHRLAEEE